ncbi:WSC domain-containing protein [Mycena sanguinolenta]|nr:WSC domain-containing protein [Mycena sanguinolenta]
MFILAPLLVFTAVAQISAQTVAPTSVGSWTYKGCFIDNPFRQLQHQKFVTGGMTVEACTSACKTAGFALAGLEFGGECWCDSFLQGTKQFADSQCAQMTCSGNSAETCGGPDRLQVYLDTSAAPPQTGVCVVTNSEDFSPIAVSKSTPATQTRLNLIDAGVGGTHAFLLTADICPTCKVEGEVQLGALLVLSSLYPDAAFVEFFNATTGDSPIGRELFTPQTNVYCAQISPVTGRIGPLVVAANGHADLWALCPNTTAGLRSDLVYSPVANHPHYTLSNCQSVWLTMAWFNQVF